MKEKYYRVAKTISRWKIDTPFENWLGSMADKSEFWKRVYVLYYRLFDHEYYIKGMPFLLKEIERQKPNCTVWGGVNYLKRDMIYSLHRFGASFEEYFVFQFYNLNAEGRSKFNTLKMQYGYCEQVNGADVRAQFEDKGKCFQLFQKYYKRDVVTYLTSDNRQELDAFIKRHPRFICKPLSGHSGQGIKIYVSEGGSIESIIQSIKGGFVVEELIEQAHPMTDLHPESINTLRVFTFRIMNDVEIIGAAIRMGTGKSFVDNAGAGGIYVGVDINEGIVNTIARDNIGNKYLKHPDTGVVFPGFKVPEWEEAKETTKKMAQVISNATMISWDLAYSTKGWCMVEGNDVGEAYLYQAQTQIGAKERIIRKIDEYVVENAK